MATLSRLDRRKLRARHVRSKVSGTAECPRMCVRVSNKRIYVQMIDDVNSATVVSGSTIAKDDQAGKTTSDASALGKKLGEQLKEKDITKVVFDRGGFKFHGRLKAVADAVREAGIRV